MLQAGGHSQAPGLQQEIQLLQFQSRQLSSYTMEKEQRPWQPKATSLLHPLSASPCAQLPAGALRALCEVSPRGDAPDRCRTRGGG